MAENPLLTFNKVKVNKLVLFRNYIATTDIVKNESFHHFIVGLSYYIFWKIDFLKAAKRLLVKTMHTENIFNLKVFHLRTEF